MKRKLNLPAGVILASKLQQRSVGEVRETYEKGDIVEVVNRLGMTHIVGEVTGIASWYGKERIPQYMVFPLSKQGVIDGRIRRRKYGRALLSWSAKSLRFLCKSE